jgi:hypothetical protein
MVNACGLAIFSNFNIIGFSVIYLSLSKIPIWTHQRQFGLTENLLAISWWELLRENQI